MTNGRFTYRMGCFGLCVHWNEYEDMEVYI